MHHHDSINDEPTPQLCGDFAALTPDAIIAAVEEATGLCLLGFSNPLNSYINRVYELQTVDRERFIAKFYRPGRWSREAILDEHDFVLGCAAEEIPVVAPLPLRDGSTLGETDGVFFAVYPKRLGRQWEACDDDGWRRLGRLLARAHMVGASAPAPHRVSLHPGFTTDADVAQLLDGGHVSPRHCHAFANVADAILDDIEHLFDDIEYIRIHGDCHAGNIFDRPGEGLLLFDFDDMAMGPPVQDLWMLLPEHLLTSNHELKLILKGYREFREFDAHSVVLIEPLRAMRMLYFLDWISRQRDDPCFERNFPHWGGESFWAEQINSLRQQHYLIREHLDAATELRSAASGRD